jgi:hypothetical protein
MGGKQAVVHIFQHVYGLILNLNDFRSKCDFVRKSSSVQVERRDTVAQFVEARRHSLKIVGSIPDSTMKIFH